MELAGWHIFCREGSGVGSAGARQEPSTWIWVIAGLGGAGEQQPTSRDKEGAG